MPNISFHPLTAENADLIATADVFDNAVDPGQLAAFVQHAGHELIFALSGDRVIGFASGTVLLHPDKVPMFFVNEVDVSEKFQRRGIATQLCQQLFALARQIGCEGIWLATEADNIAARALYAKLNAQETEDIVVYDWDGVMPARPD